MWLLCEVDPADGTRLTPRIVLQHVPRRVDRATKPTTRLIGEYAEFMKFMISIRWSHVMRSVDITDLPPDTTAETLGATPVGQVGEIANATAKEWASRFKCIAFERGGVTVDNRGGKMLLDPVDDQGDYDKTQTGCYDVVTNWV